MRPYVSGTRAEVTYSLQKMLGCSQDDAAYVLSLLDHHLSREDDDVWVLWCGVDRITEAWGELVALKVARERVLAHQTGEDFPF